MLEVEVMSQGKSWEMKKISNFKNIKESSNKGRFDCKKKKRTGKELKVFSIFMKIAINL